MIINDNELNCLREVNERYNARWKFYEQHSRTICRQPNQMEVPSEEESLIIQQNEELRFRVICYLESLDDKMLDFLLCAKEIGSYQNDYKHESYQERFEACQKSLKAAGLPRITVITKLTNFHPDKPFDAGIRHLGYKIE
ncbi:hypothetical protein SAMN03159341_11735 [Paenibacillus sp. 1_12]|uniref:hypothetical protein n=1 Tax=Paenibacillus sp. 1_12 TaxID=1566278 RepID=UPI0008F39178|nr:hypothetical protein [Paenibacillus sp. 1_12]SFM12249.1 hypothetical protein SAMN03159341_11735 [Paenibacillus sp. 1_12]